MKSQKDFVYPAQPFNFTDEETESLVLWPVSVFPDWWQANEGDNKPAAVAASAALGRTEQGGINRPYETHTHPQKFYQLS